MFSPTSRPEITGTPSRARNLAAAPDFPELLRDIVTRGRTWPPRRTSRNRSGTTLRAAGPGRRAGLP
ncbi:MAG: hypothetical protein LBT40_06065 [Deltaproteobacteria bacterium]|nr:hypothetical protein [Deltaproteobacteria bacterium]